MSDEQKTGFSDKLTIAQTDLINDLVSAHDLTTQPGKISLLAGINQIVQSQRLVALGGRILTEIQVANQGSPSITLESSTLTIEPRFRRVKGMEEVSVNNAVQLSIEVIAGEVYSSHGEGALPPGHKIAFDGHGQIFNGEINFVGADPDSDYLITWLSAEPTKVEELVEPETTPVILEDLEDLDVEEPIDPDPQPLTGDLLPQPNDLESFLSPDTAPTTTN